MWVTIKGAIACPIQDKKNLETDSILHGQYSRGDVISHKKWVNNDTADDNYAHLQHGHDVFHRLIPGRLLVNAAFSLGMPQG